MMFMICSSANRLHEIKHGLQNCSVQINYLSFDGQIVTEDFCIDVSTGRARLIRSHSSARFCFELSGNSN